MRTLAELASDPNTSMVVSSLPSYELFVSKGLTGVQNFVVTGGAEVKFTWINSTTPRSYGIILNDPLNQMDQGFAPYNAIGTQIAGALMEMKKVGLHAATPNTTSPGIMDYLNAHNKYLGFSSNRNHFAIQDRLVDEIQASTVGTKLPRR